jgi:hypothetical protein
LHNKRRNERKKIMMVKMFAQQEKEWEEEDHDGEKACTAREGMRGRRS